MFVSLLHQPTPLFLLDFFSSFCFPLAPRAALQGPRAVEAAPPSPLRLGGGAEHHGKGFSRRRPGSPARLAAAAAAAGRGGGCAGAAGALGEQGEPGTGEAGHGLRVVAGGCVLSLCQKISGWAAWSLLVLRRFSHGSALLLHPAAGASRSAAGRGSDAEMKAGGGAGARRV